MIYKGVELYNVQELLDVPGGEGKLCSRIPNALRVRLNESAQFRALETAGCEARFMLRGARAPDPAQHRAAFHYRGLPGMLSGRLARGGH